jgi:hypothetical protein
VLVAAHHEVHLEALVGHVEQLGADAGQPAFAEVAR